MPSCFVSSCKMTQRNKPKDVKFHRFPIPIKKEWLQALGEAPDKHIPVNSIICSTHFMDKDFETKGTVKLLKKDALPSVNLPTCVKQEIFHEENPSTSKMAIPLPIGTVKKFEEIILGYP